MRTVEDIKNNVEALEFIKENHIEKGGDVKDLFEDGYKKILSPVGVYEFTTCVKTFYPYAPEDFPFYSSFFGGKLSKNWYVEMRKDCDIQKLKQKLENNKYVYFGFVKKMSKAKTELYIFLDELGDTTMKMMGKDNFMGKILED